MIIKELRVVCGLALLFGLLSGCSGSDGSSGEVECVAVTPCGGDLSGTWKVAAACFSDAQKTQLEESLKACDAGSASVSASASGTATYDAGALKEDITVALDVSDTVPTSCLNGLTCASLQTQIAAKSAEGVTNATCHTTADGCTCTYSQTIHIKDEYSYTTSDSTLTEVDPSDGSITTVDYCVAGNKLTEKDHGDDSISVYTR